MKIRDLGVIEITVFAAALAAFLVFFGLFIMLRHRRMKGNRRNFSEKQLAMENAVREKTESDRRNPYRTSEEAFTGGWKETKESFKQNHFEKNGVLNRSSGKKQMPATGKNPAKPQESTFFVEERRISHRRDQLRKSQAGETRD